MANVFLSYAREDRGFAEALARIVERAEHEVWWDRHVGAGAEFSTEIEGALERSDAVLVLWSAASAKSPWVRDEAAIGRDTGRLVPVTLDGSQPPIGFRQFQTLDLTGWKSSKRDARVAALLDAIAQVARQSAENDGKPERSGAEARHEKRARLPLGWAAAGGLAVLILAAAAFFLMRPSRAEASTSVVVLPFTDLSPTHDKAYLAQGISEQILSALATVPRLRIIGRTSALALGSDPDPASLRAKLGVTDLVEGSARTLNDELRVDVRLIRTSDGSEIWSHEYRGKLEQIFDVQDDIANSVAAQLNLAAAPGRQTAAAPGQQSVGAYEMYLAARALERARTLPKLQQAMSIARDLVSRYPNYAKGHALLGELTILLSNGDSSYGSTPLAVARPIAIREAQEAIRLAPRDAAGYAALGIAVTGQASVSALQKAIQLDPSRAELRLWLGLTLTAQRRNDEAEEQYRSATEVEPLWPVPLLDWTLVLSASHREREALDAIDQFRARGGDEGWADTIEGDVKVHSGDLAGALQSYAKALAIDPSLRNAHFGIAEARHYLALPPDVEGNSAVNSPFLVDFLDSGLPAVQRRIAADPSSAWGTFLIGTVLRALAITGDWKDVLAVYDKRSPASADVCVAPPSFTPTLVLALRQANRQGEANALLACFQSSITRQMAMTYRHSNDFAGSLEEMQAAALALHGDRRAVDWLRRAVALGWIGQDWSPDLRQWPEFDAVRSDPQMNVIQQDLSTTYQRQRASALSHAGGS